MATDCTNAVHAVVPTSLMRWMASASEMSPHDRRRQVVDSRPTEDSAQAEDQGLELNGTDLGLGTQGPTDKYLGRGQLMGQLLDLLLLLSQ